MTAAIKAFLILSSTSIIGLLLYRFVTKKAEWFTLKKYFRDMRNFFIESHSRIQNNVCSSVVSFKRCLVSKKSPPTTT